MWSASGLEAPNGRETCQSILALLTLYYWILHQFFKLCEPSYEHNITHLYFGTTVWILWCCSFGTWTWPGLFPPSVSFLVTKMLLQKMCDFYVCCYPSIGPQTSWKVTKGYVITIRSYLRPSIILVNKTSHHNNFLIHCTFHMGIQ